MLTDLLDNKYVKTGITIMLGLYAALLGPELPKSVRDLFENSIFKMVVLFFVVVRGNKDPQMALMIAIAYVLTLEYLQKQDVISGFASVSLLENMENNDSLPFPTPDLPLSLEMPIETYSMETMDNLNYIEAMANLEFADDMEEDKPYVENFGDVEDDDRYELFSEDDGTEFADDDDDEERGRYAENFDDDEEGGGYAFAHEDGHDEELTYGYAENFGDNEEDGNYTYAANDEEGDDYTYESFADNEEGGDYAYAADDDEDHGRYAENFTSL
jgi:hypothetical protein